MGLYEHVVFKPLHLTIRCILQIMGGLKVTGSENIPLEGGAILACNHVSLSDPLLLLATVPRPLYYMAASELFEIPYFNKLISFLRAFPVQRGHNDSKALRKCFKLLKAGEAVVMYPEGRLNDDPNSLGPLMPGVATLGMRAQVPIYPIVHFGTDKFFPRRAKWIHYAFKEIRFGPPLMLPPLQKNSEMSIKEQTEAASELLRKALLALY